MKGKLSTTPYNVERAHEAYNFISLGFVPRSRPDHNDHEGGMEDVVSAVTAESVTEPTPSASTPLSQLSSKGPNTLTIRLPPLTQPLASPSHSTSTSHSGKENVAAADSVNNMVPDNDVSADEEERTRRSFCPDEHRQPLVDMMERHLCAHPLIPGYSHPSKEGIRAWAVKQAYEFCVKRDLPELWAYLWENWYRHGRWHLWARSACEDAIPRLKTTMFVEAQYVP